MAKAEQSKRVDIGFIAGQVLSLRLTEGVYQDFVRSLKEEGGWRKIAADDAEIVLDIGKVAYVRVATEEPKVGFADS